MLRTTINGGGDSSLLQLHPKRIFAVLGLVGKGCPLPNIGRSLTKGFQDDTSCRLERGTFIPFDSTEETLFLIQDRWVAVTVTNFYFRSSIFLSIYDL